MAKHGNLERPVLSSTEWRRAPVLCWAAGRPVAFLYVLTSCAQLIVLPRPLLQMQRGFVTNDMRLIDKLGSYSVDRANRHGRCSSRTQVFQRFSSWPASRKRQLFLPPAFSLSKKKGFSLRFILIFVILCLFRNEKHNRKITRHVT